MSMPVVASKLFIVILAALGVMTMSTTSVILSTDEGEKMEVDYDHLAEVWQEDMTDELSSHFEVYVNEETGRYSKEALQEHTFGNLVNRLESDLPEGQTFTDKQKEALFDTLYEKVPEDFWSDLQKDVDEQQEDQELYRRNPWGYHGIRQSDFWTPNDYLRN